MRNIFKIFHQKTVCCSKCKDHGIKDKKCIDCNIKQPCGGLKPLYCNDCWND